VFNNGIIVVNKVDEAASESVLSIVTHMHWCCDGQVIAMYDNQYEAKPYMYFVM
jgi:hypothetical protein